MAGVDQPQDAQLRLVCLARTARQQRAPGEPLLYPAQQRQVDVV
jgi:hypothetical protein